ncbi:MAG: dethiobiotin synthase [Pseudomonadota bacterium]|nr:dethiobiotin synthase [Pseudomonadota bacterium]
MTAAFVTATGTGIGKTFVTAGLVRYFRQCGRAVEAFKPVVSGFNEAAAGLSDPAILLAALRRPSNMDEIARISPWRFAAPLSPDMAAREEGRAIDFAELVAFSKKAINAAENVLIEGIGGIMVPLDERRTTLDWMQKLELPLILVAGSYLGSISHTLSALDVLRRRKLDLRAIVVDETKDSPVALKDAAAAIARFAAMTPVIALPRLGKAAEPHPAFESIARLL